MYYAAIGTLAIPVLLIENYEIFLRGSRSGAKPAQRIYRRFLFAVLLYCVTDVLTGVKSKLAFVEMQEKKDLEIREGRAAPFAFAVFDLNGLKQINDSRGHEQGDRYIVRACRIICSHFKHSPVYRIGGDEFAALLDGADYPNRQALCDGFRRMMADETSPDCGILAMGMAEFDPETDHDFSRVFERADLQMYGDKHSDAL